jgi:hypothetical protein
MPVWRILAATTAISSGTVLASSGPAGVSRILATIVSHAGEILLGFAAVAIVHSALRPGRRLTPIATAITGGLVYLAQTHGLWHRYGWMALGLLIVCGGIWIMAAAPTQRRRRSARQDVDTHRRVIGVPLHTGHLSVADEARTPRHISVLACLGSVMVDFTDAEAPPVPLIEVFITEFAGDVTLLVPPHWVTVAGRVTATRAVEFNGKLDLSRPIEDPSGEYGELRGLLAQKSSGSSGPRGAVVVVHVVGFQGTISVDSISPPVPVTAPPRSSH